MASADEAKRWVALTGLPVFPVVPSGKEPATGSFPELATTDPTKIDNWWIGPVGHNDYNIGVLMGNGYVLLDVDTRKGQEALTNYHAIGGHFDTLTVRTASGGYHAIFKLPEGQAYRNAQGVVPFVDVRCENGYGIAPGSFVAEPRKGTYGFYELAADKPIAPVPASVLSLLQPLKPRGQRLNGHADAEKAIPLYTEWLSVGAPVAIEGQGGNQTTYDVACMGVRDYGLTIPTVYQLMLEHYNPRCVPPWTPDEILQLVENADSYAIGETGSKDPDKLLSGVTFTPPIAQSHFVPPQAPGPVTYRRFPKGQSIKVMEWLVPPILLRGEVTMLSGPPGAGKSGWVLALACHAAVGKPFGPYMFEKPFASMIYNPEDGIDAMAGRANVTCKLNHLDYDAVSSKVLPFDHNDKIIYLADKVNGQIRTPDETIKFLDGVMEQQPDTALFNFDPFVRMIRGCDENDNNEMSEVMQWITAIAKNYNVAVALGHHTPKGMLSAPRFNPNTIDVARGAGAIITTARVAMNILPQTSVDAGAQGERSDVFSTRVVKNNHGPTGKAVWWKRTILLADNGQPYVTPANIEVRNLVNEHHSRWVDTIGDYMIQYSLNDLKLTDAALIIAESDPDDPRSVKTLINALREYAFKRGMLSHRYIDHNGVVYDVRLIVTDAAGNTVRGQYFIMEEAHTVMQLPPVILPPRELTIEDYK